jgi:hypothetical protein
VDAVAKLDMYAATSCSSSADMVPNNHSTIMPSL